MKRSERLKRRKKKEQMKPFVDTLYAVISSRLTTEQAAIHALSVMNGFMTQCGFKPIDRSRYFVKQA